jgi:hypothetical protein
MFDIFLGIQMLQKHCMKIPSVRKNLLQIWIFFTVPFVE